MVKQARSLRFLIVVALLAGACASQGASGGDEPSNGSAKVGGSLFAYGFGYKTGDEIAQVRVDRFRKMYPDVKIKFSESGFEEQPFLSALAGDDPPDVVNLPRSLIGTYIARGVLEPLDDCIEQESIDMDAFYESAVDQVTVDGSPYAVPEFYNTRVWMIDNKAFKEAGLDPKTFDFSDWEAIAEANKKLTKVEGGKLTRIGIDPMLPEFLPFWARANGASMISDEGTESQLEDPAVAEALKFGASLQEPAGGATAFADFKDTWDFFGAENQFVNHQLAAMPMDQWYLTVLAEVSPNVDITVRPFVTRDGEPITWSDGNSWAIPTATQNFDAACALVAAMTEKQAWLAAARERVQRSKAQDYPNVGVYTGNKEADKIIFDKMIDPNGLEQGVKEVIEHQDSENAFSAPPSPAAALFQETWIAAAQRALEGADPDKELRSADQRAQEAIDAAAR